MAQDHLDRLTSVDSSFLHQEDGRDSHMHIGGIAIMDGPSFSVEEFTAHVESRLHLLPRYRQKLAFPPFGSGRPLWVDDPSFRIGYHVRVTALPAPGTQEQLLALAARITSQRLDRTRPLWELWIVEGLEGGRLAMINKTHHALLDGVGGIDLMTALLDLTPEARDTGDHPWQPNATPGRVGMLAHGLKGAIRNVTSLAGTGVHAVRHPQETIGVLTASAEALGEVAASFINAAPATPLNVPPGPHRRIALLREELSDFKVVKAAFGGTVNDVILTAVAGGLARYLEQRGFTPEQRLRACVPVSVRTPGQKDAMGNRITIMVAPLPVDVADPVERLAAVRAEMADLKDSKQAQGAALLTQMENFAPPTVLAQASKLGFSPRLYNLLVTNVPGPQFPVYLRGREVLEVYPIAFLAPTHTLAVAIISYNGGVHLGLLADYDNVSDVDVLAREIDSALGELVAAAKMAQAATPAADAPAKPAPRPRKKAAAAG